MAVKLILTEVVEHLGGPGDIVQVAPGYARNYLLPRQVAMEATDGNLRMLENRRKVWHEQERREIEHAEALKNHIDRLDFRFKRRAGERGTLFGSVTNADIAAYLGEKSVEMDKRNISIKRPIKSLGEHDITLKLHRKLTMRVSVTVDPEDPPKDAVAEEKVAAAEAAAGETVESAEGAVEATAPAEEAGDTAEA